MPTRAMDAAVRILEKRETNAACLTPQALLSLAKELKGEKRFDKACDILQLARDDETGIPVDRGERFASSTRSACTRTPIEAPKRVSMRLSSCCVRIRTNPLPVPRIARLWAWPARSTSASGSSTEISRSWFDLRPTTSGAVSGGS